MLKDTKHLPHSRVRLTISVTAHGFAHAFDHEVEELGKDLKIEGFRPGKAPRAKVIEKLGRSAIEAQSLDHAVSHAYYDALKEGNLVPVAGPEVEVTSFTAPAESTPDDTEVAVFTAEVDVIPSIELKGYQKMKVKPQTPKEITDADVQEVLDYLRRQRASLKEATEGEVLKIAKGMWADISYAGSVDGVAREDMKSDHHPLMVGEGRLIPGFEEELIGMQVGESKTFQITFPKDYHAKQLQGKKAEFSVTVNEVKDVILPPLEDDFAVPFGHKTLPELEQAIKTNLVEERVEEAKRKTEDLVIEEFLKHAKFDLPQSLVTQERARVLSESQERVKSMGMEWGAYLTQIGKKEEEIEQELNEQAEKNVRIGLALGKLIQLENITEQDEAAMRAAVDRLVEIATK